MHEKARHSNNLHNMSPVMFDLVALLTAQNSRQEADRHIMSTSQCNVRHVWTARQDLCYAVNGGLHKADVTPIGIERCLEPVCVDGSMAKHARTH